MTFCLGYYPTHSFTNHVGCIAMLVYCHDTCMHEPVQNCMTDIKAEGSKQLWGLSAKVYVKSYQLEHLTTIKEVLATTNKGASFASVGLDPWTDREGADWSATFLWLQGCVDPVAGAVESTFSQLSDPIPRILNASFSCFNLPILQTNKTWSPNDNPNRQHQPLSPWPWLI